MRGGRRTSGISSRPVYRRTRKTCVRFLPPCYPADVEQRATARDLLENRFIRNARSTSRLVELVERNQAFKRQNPSKPSTPSKTLNKQAAGFGMTMVGGGTMRSEWNFDETIRGTVRGMPVQLDLAEMEEEEWAFEEEERGEIVVHCRVVDRSRFNVSPGIENRLTDQASEISLPILERSPLDTPPLGSSPQTPTSDMMDLKSSKSQASLKSTWKQRHNQGQGTIVKQGDLGDGSVGHLFLQPYSCR